MCRVPPDHDYRFEVAHLPTLNEDGSIEPTESCPLRCWTREELQTSLNQPQPDLLLLGRRTDAQHVQQVNASVQRIPAPRYQVANSNAALPLGTNTVGLSATGWGAEGPGAHHFDTHSLYGFTEAVATHTALREVTKARPFVLTRSSFPGTGRYAAHWTGDNAATWNDLHWSIAGVINAGLYGMPMAGADICGFGGQPDRELCARWIGVGAMYPFSRNHHAIAAGEQVREHVAGVQTDGHAACVFFFGRGVLLLDRAHRRKHVCVCTCTTAVRRSSTGGQRWQTLAARHSPCAMHCYPTCTQPCTTRRAVGAQPCGRCGSTTRPMQPRLTSTGRQRTRSWLLRRNMMVNVFILGIFFLLQHAHTCTHTQQ